MPGSVWVTASSGGSGPGSATVAQPYSEPVFGTTLSSFGPQEFLTAFETSDAVYTPYEAEIEWTRRIDVASDRVRVVTIGHTVQGREINLFIIGYPAPPATAEAISTVADRRCELQRARERADRA